MNPLRLVGVIAGCAVVLCTFAYIGLQSMSAPSEPFVNQSLTAVASVPAGGRVPTGRPVARPAHASTTVSEQWVATTAAKAGIPVPAVRAYADAQLAEPAGCDVGWTTLAGIGWVESQNGTIGGRTLGDDGHSSTPILGPALNGHGKLAAIRATPASTAWHGDPTWDHAVGPLQFIPSTWETWGADGDGDGVADPNDLDDAAYTAALYLCAGGYDLSTGSGWAAAVFSYNHAQSYVDAVYAASSAYADRTR